MASHMHISIHRSLRHGNYNTAIHTKSIFIVHETCDTGEQWACSVPSQLFSNMIEAELEWVTSHSEKTLEIHGIMERIEEESFPCYPPRPREQGASVKEENCCTDVHVKGGSERRLLETTADSRGTCVHASLSAVGDKSIRKPTIHFEHAVSIGVTICLTTAVTLCVV